MKKWEKVRDILGTRLASPICSVARIWGHAILEFYGDFFT